MLPGRPGLCSHGHRHENEVSRPDSSRRYTISLGSYEYHCGGCVTTFFNEKGHQEIQRNGAWCEQCAGELILVWQPRDPE